MLPSEWLQQHEWIRNSLYTYNNKGQCIGGCLLGAIKATIHTKKESTRFRQVLLTLIQQYMQRQCNDNIEYIMSLSIPDVNDRNIPSKEVAVTVLQDAERVYFHGL